mgnify:CR=1 FL=1
MSEDIFGSTLPRGVTPEDLPELKPRKGMSLDEHLNRTVRRTVADHNARSRKLLEGQGYTVCKTEYRDMAWQGNMAVAGKKHDLLGLGDYLAVSESLTVLVQVCSEDGWRAHLRKACSSEIDSKSGKARIDNLRLWIQGETRRFLILAWEKDGRGWWQPIHHWITEKDIEETLGRRRK